MTEQVKSTKSQIEKFKDSFIWMDIVDELRRLQKNAMIEYDLVGEPIVDDDGMKRIPNSSETLIHLGDIKGRRKAVEYFLSIPDILISILEDQENDLRRDKADRPGTGPGDS